MNRLTWYNGDYWTQVQDAKVGYKDICARLAAYEDTGMTPEQIRNAQETLRCFDDIGIKRGNEIVTAEAEGRLVVLPCKEGTEVYKISFRLSGEYEIIKTWFSLTYIKPNDFGKTVFLTREEAEKAIAKEAE